MSKLRWPRTDAIAVAETIIDRLAPFVHRIEIAGSIRRRRPFVGDIEIVAIPATVPDGLFGDPRMAIPECRDAALAMGHRVKAGDRYVQVREVAGSPLTLDLFLVHPPADWGCIYAIRTGPAGFGAACMDRIRSRGMFHRDGRIVDGRGRHLPCPTEDDFFRTIGIDPIPPDRRRNPPGWKAGKAGA